MTTGTDFVLLMGALQAAHSPSFNLSSHRLTLVVANVLILIEQTIGLLSTSTLRREVIL